MRAEDCVLKEAPSRGPQPICALIGHQICEERPCSRLPIIIAIDTTLDGSTELHKQHHKALHVPGRAGLKSGAETLIYNLHVLSGENLREFNMAALPFLNAPALSNH